MAAADIGRLSSPSKGAAEAGHASRSAATLMKETELIPLAPPPPPPSSPGLLGPQDLREECIKLKKRVFDLERQNQMLSALFQQKLQLTTGSLPQVGTSNSPSLLLPHAASCLSQPYIFITFFSPST